MEIIYRQTTPSDLDALVSLRAAFLCEFYKLPSLDTPILTAIREYFSRAVPTGEFVGYFAESCGQIVATGGLIYDRHIPSPTNPTGRQAYILNVYTLPAFRRRGIASAILTKLLDHAKSDGCAKVSLHTVAQARDMYAKAGFTPNASEKRLELK